MRRSAVLSAVLACALACALVGCGTPQPDPPVVTETPPVAPTAEATPTEVGFGNARSVAWSPTSDVEGELTMSVDKVRAGDFGDFAGLAGSGITEANSPFYVDVAIANTGEVDLGGRDVPLYLADSGAVLSPPWSFAEPFEPCASGPLPETFAGGDETEVCLVFFASPDATFESVTFQPTLETAAVTWTGEVATQKAKAKVKARARAKAKAKVRAKAERATTKRR